MTSSCSLKSDPKDPNCNCQQVSVGSDRGLVLHSDQTIIWNDSHGGTTEEGNCSYLLPLSHRDSGLFSWRNLQLPYFSYITNQLTQVITVTLTHCGLLTSNGDIDHWLTAPSRYLNQCWRFISEVHWHLPVSASWEIHRPSFTKISLKFTYMNFRPVLTMNI